MDLEVRSGIDLMDPSPRGLVDDPDVGLRDDRQPLVTADRIRLLLASQEDRPQAPDRRGLRQRAGRGQARRDVADDGHEQAGWRANPWTAYVRDHRRNARLGQG